MWYSIGCNWLYEVRWKIHLALQLYSLWIVVPSFALIAPFLSPHHFRRFYTIFILAESTVFLPCFFHAASVGSREYILPGARNRRHGKMMNGWMSVMSCLPGLPDAILASNIVGRSKDSNKNIRSFSISGFFFSDVSVEVFWLKLRWSFTHLHDRMWANITFDKNGF